MPDADPPFDPPTIDTRLAGAADAAVVAALFLETTRHYWGERPDDAADSRRAADRLLGDGAGSRLLLAFRGGEPVGYASFAILQPGPSEHGVLFMKDLFVRAQARGDGLGETLMRHLAGLAVDLGCRRLDWTAESDNPRAIAFYDGLAASRVVEKVYFRLAGDRLATFAAAPADRRLPEIPDWE